jgi:hypothetical protein
MSEPQLLFDPHNPDRLTWPATPLCDWTTDAGIVPLDDYDTIGEGLMPLDDKEWMAVDDRIPIREVVHRPPCIVTISLILLNIDDLISFLPFYLYDTTHEA